MNLKLKPKREEFITNGMDGELLLEFDKMNCNEKELELLEYIFKVSLEHMEKLLEQFENIR